MAGKRKKPSKAARQPSQPKQEDEEYTEGTAEVQQTSTRRASERVAWHQAVDLSLRESRAATTAPHAGESEEDVVDSTSRRQPTAPVQAGAVEVEVEEVTETGRPLRKAAIAARERVVEVDEGSEQTLQANEEERRETIPSGHLTVRIACIFLPYRHRTVEYAFLLSQIPSIEAIQKIIGKHFYADFVLANAAKNVRFTTVIPYGPFKHNDRPTTKIALEATMQGRFTLGPAYLKWYKAIKKRKDFTNDDEILVDIAYTELADDQKGDLEWAEPDVRKMDTTGMTNWQLKYEASNRLLKIYREELLELKAFQFTRTGSTRPMADGKEPWRKYLPENLHKERIAKVGTDEYQDE